MIFTLTFRHAQQNWTLESHHTLTFKYAQQYWTLKSHQKIRACFKFSIGKNKSLHNTLGKESVKF